MTSANPKPAGREAPVQKTRVQKRTEEQRPTARVNEGAATPGKSPDQQRRDSRLELGRPKDSGRCGA